MTSKSLTLATLIALGALVACSKGGNASASTAATVAAPSAAPAANAAMVPSMAGMSDNVATKTGAGAGVVTALDRKAGTVTIKHGPIPEIGWPGMTMTFKADPPSLLDGLKTGAEVRFTLQGAGNAYRVTAIAAR